MAIFNQLNSLTSKTALIATTFIVLSTGAAQAFDLGTYKLENHPDGGAADSYGSYGLRLDGLLDRDSDSTTVFDFEADGANMFLNYDGTEIRIYGTAYNQEYDDFWSIDFTYQNVTKKEDGLIVKSDRQSLGDGIGSIAAANGVPSNDFDMVDFSGNHNYTFQIANGHRGLEDYSGFGWLNHGATEEELAVHMYHSDWLFKVGESVSVPEPASALSFVALGVLVTSSVSKSGVKQGKERD